MKCRDWLHELVKEDIEKKDSSTEEWKIAMERSFNRMDNEWATIERLPTFERLRSSLFDENDGSNVDAQGKRAVDVTKLGALEQNMFIDKLIEHIENDNLRLLHKLRKRIDKHLLRPSWKFEAGYTAPPPKKTQLVDTVVTIRGYLAPEYALLGQLTKKADVYSFGVLVLEIISSRSSSKTAFEI